MVDEKPDQKPEIPPEIRPMFDIFEKMGGEAFKAAVAEGIKSADAKDVDALTDGTQITIDFDHTTKEVHPAVDIVGDKAFIGAVLPCLVTKKSKDEDKFDTTESKDLQFLITSNREKILMKDDELRKHGYRLAHNPVAMRGKWSERAIKEFLMGFTQVPEIPKLFYTLREGWSKNMEFDNDSYYDFLTLWVAGTYFFVVFPTYPYTYFGGIKGVGKTKALNIAALTCFNAILSSSITSASLFRLIQSGRCTILVDEGEMLRYSEKAQDLRSSLLAGYKRGSKVYRTEKTAKEQFQTVGYEVYSPKMVANIGGMDNVLADRVIPLIIRRGLNRNIINADPNEQDPVWGQLRDAFHILFLLKFKEVQEIYTEFSVGSVGSEGSVGYQERGLEITGRVRELWQPILIMAKFFDKYLKRDPSLENKMLDLIKEYITDKKQEDIIENLDFLVMMELNEKITAKDEYHPVSRITDWVKANYSNPPDWLKPETVGRALRRLGFKDSRRINKGIEYHLTRAQVEDTIKRLKLDFSKEEPSSNNPTLPAQPAQPTLKDSLATKEKEPKPTTKPQDNVCSDCGNWQGVDLKKPGFCSELSMMINPRYTCPKFQPRQRPGAAP